MKRELKNFDFVIVIAVMAIFFIGLTFLYSASSSFTGNASSIYVTRQISWILVGFLLFIISVSIDYRRILDISYPVYFAALFFLVLVLFIGAKRLGAQRWIAIGSFIFQPSETAKIAFIMALSAFLGRRKDDISSTRNLFGALMFFVPFFCFIVIQPDLGTALVLLPIMLSMLYVAGVNGRSLLVFIGAGLLASPFFWHFLKGYQKRRLMVFLNPNIDPLGSGYTIIQSKIAIGSGQLLGKGLLSGTQSQLNFIPERHTDFIFAVIGEEWGFAGSLLLVSLFFLIIYRGIIIIEQTSDIFGKLMATGIVTLFAFQVIVNIGMTSGLLPVVGITLPFVSYGGSSLLTSMIAMGLLINVGMRRPLF